MCPDKPVHEERFVYSDPKLATYLHEQFAALRREIRTTKEEVLRRADDAVERFRKENPEMRDRREFIDGMRELGRRLDALKQQFTAHLDTHASQRRATARLNRYKKTRDRDGQGRLMDQLLEDVEGRRRLLKISQRRLASELGVDFRCLSKWLARKRSPQQDATRQRMKDWLKETEAEAVLIDKHLAVVLAEWA